MLRAPFRLRIYQGRDLSLEKTRIKMPKTNSEKAGSKSSPDGKANHATAEPVTRPEDVDAVDSSEIISFLPKTPKKVDDSHLAPFLRQQRERLLALRDAMLDSMMGVAQDNLRSRAEGSEASAFGMHQADAGSDAYDRDFALSLLSQEQDALYEIDEALKRIELGTYGVCEMSSKQIPKARLEAIPFARFTVECQSQLERQKKNQRARQSVTSLFGLTDDEGGDSDDEEPAVDTKD
jgi:DnaK suppressor protein